MTPSAWLLLMVGGGLLLTRIDRVDNVEVAIFLGGADPL